MALPDEADLSTKDLVDAQVHIWNHMHSFINSMSLKCAVELGIPDAIHKHGKPITLPELANALSINKSKSNGLYRLMRLLAHSKFFTVSTKDNEEAYCLTRASRLLLTDAPTSVAPFVLTALDPVVMDPFQHLTEWFRNGDSSPFLTKHGKAPFEYPGFDQRWNELYNEGVASDARFVANILVRECKHVFAGLKTMVDVGGGTGMVARAVADAFPGLKCTVLDLPHVVAALEGSQNLSFVSGDMFESIPHADAIFLKWILNMCNNEEGVKLLGKCKEALNPNNGGKVIIADMIVGNQKGDDDATETQLCLDMHMLTRFAGGERTEKEWAKLFLDAGFTSYKITPVLGLRSVIEVFP